MSTISWYANMLEFIPTIIRFIGFRYVPAYSTRLKFEGDEWQVLPGNSSDPLGLVDPIWTESYWDSIGLRVYKVQSSILDHIVVVGGISITVLSYAAAIFTRTFFVKVIKHDWLNLIVLVPLNYLRINIG